VIEIKCLKKNNFQDSSLDTALPFLAKATVFQQALPQKDKSASGLRVRTLKNNNSKKQQAINPESTSVPRRLAF
jgi:hypothetical protein